ncbi:MAG: M14 family metallopeptidase [Candidatus Aminicenantaceae bacterium]
MKTKIFFFSLFFSFIVLSQAQPIQKNQKIISVENNKESVNLLLSMESDLLMEWDKKIYFIGGQTELTLLNKKNISYNIEYLSSSFYPNKIPQNAGANGAYHSYKELEQEINLIEISYPEIAKVYDIGDSLEKRNIYALKVSDNVQLDESEAKIIFIGCHHAREWISVEIPLLLGQYLTEKYSLLSNIKDLIDKSEIWIIPMLNPDGLEYSIHYYRYWRKNMRDNGDGTYGVDLNRNYRYKWGYDDKGSSSYTGSNTYRGPSPFSEPETQAIRDLFVSKHFQALISYHSYSQLILYPWGYIDTPAQKDDQFNQIGQKMSDLIESVNGNNYKCVQSGKDLYLTNGDTTDWSYGVYNIPSFTIELPPVDILHGGFFNAEEDIDIIFNENLPAMLYLIEWSIQNYSS